MSTTLVERSTKNDRLSFVPVRLVLASSSPRRAELLRAAHFEFDTVPATVDERTRPNEPPEDYVLRLASEKSAAAQSSTASEALILAADTAVVVGAQILGKPENDAEVGRMLRQLSGRAHQVMTGVSIRRGAREVRDIESTTVWFTTLTAEDILWYVASGEGRDKAGAYAIQGRAARFIPRIEGSYSNVVGLPIALVQAMISRLTSS
jgi:nucleoside triphosphate pyrophosphatase